MKIVETIATLVLMLAMLAVAVVLLPVSLLIGVIVLVMNKQA